MSFLTHIKKIFFKQKLRFNLNKKYSNIKNTSPGDCILNALLVKLQIKLKINIHQQTI